MGLFLHVRSPFKHILCVNGTDCIVPFKIVNTGKFFWKLLHGTERAFRLVFEYNLVNFPIFQISGNVATHRSVHAHNLIVVFEIIKRFAILDLRGNC